MSPCDPDIKSLTGMMFIALTKGQKQPLFLYILAPFMAFLPGLIDYRAQSESGVRCYTKKNITRFLIYSCCIFSFERRKDLKNEFGLGWIWKNSEKSGNLLEIIIKYWNAIENSFCLLSFQIRDILSLNVNLLRPVFI